VSEAERRRQASEAYEGSLERSVGSLSETRYSTAEGQQAFSLEQAQHQLKADKAASDQRIKEQQTTHDLAEEKKDNDLKRLTFRIVLGVFIGVLVVSFIAAVWSDNASTRSWAQGIVTTIMGAIAGGVVGYFTGKHGK
jgi:cation transport ATPase